MTNGRIAIIGAGMAGLACAERLRAAGLKATLFDKGRGPGGRMATRRVTLPDGYEVRFDHGAQYVTARDRGFAAVCAKLTACGAAQPFPWPVFSRSKAGADADADICRYAGANGMNAIPKALARQHTVCLERRVTALSPSRSGWRIGFSDGASASGFDAVVLATPAEQAVPLLEGVCETYAEEAAAARTAPCWAGLFVFEGGGEPAFGALRLDEGGPLSWLARTADGQGWVAHASVAWSRLNLEISAESVARGLEAAVRQVLPEVGRTLAAQAHRWRYARVETQARKAFAWNGDKGLGVCGDWRLGPSVEAAWRSGDQLGAAIAASKAGA